MRPLQTALMEPIGAAHEQRHIAALRTPMFEALGQLSRRPALTAFIKCNQRVFLADSVQHATTFMGQCSLATITQRDLYQFETIAPR